MLPNVHILGKDIPTYGLLAGLGILLAVLYFKLEERRAKLNLRESADTEMAFLWGLVGTFTGAKLLSLLTQLPALAENWEKLFTHTDWFLQTYLLSGFVFYGGLYGCLLGTYLYGKAARLSFSSLLKRLMPVVPLVHAFGRLGCFCTGCCYGIPGKTLGLYFTASAIAPHHEPLLPVQLYEAVLEGGLFVLLHGMHRKGKEGNALLGVYLFLYGISRFLLEFLRGDGYRGFVGPLSTSQIISIPTILWGLWLLIRLKKRKLACA